MNARRALIGLLAVAAAALVACGGDEQAEPLGEVRAGSVTLLADCGDWNRGTVEERMATVREVRAGESPGNQAQTHTDEQVYEFFERNCARQYAKTFRLYKLYTGAAPYIGLEP